jgi:hypothetical protein
MPFVTRGFFNLGTDEEGVGIFDFEDGRFADLFDLSPLCREDDWSIRPASGRLGGLN